MVFAGTGVTCGRGTRDRRRHRPGDRDRPDRGAHGRREAAADAAAAASRTPVAAMVALGVAVTVVLTLGDAGAGRIAPARRFSSVSRSPSPPFRRACRRPSRSRSPRAHGRWRAAARSSAASLRSRRSARATVIATDKTGTLTVNQLRVAAVHPRAGPDRGGRALEVAALASTADLLEADGVTRVAGDPVDGAFLLALAARRRRRSARRGGPHAPAAAPLRPAGGSG